MDIYDYFNSPDIAEYCKSIGHKFNPFEMAVLIDRSHRTTAEKHAGWREIINNYPNMPTPINDSGGSYESLHKELAKRIEFEEYLLEIFMKPEDGAFYKYDAWSGISGGRTEYVFDNFEKVLAEAVDSYKYDLKHNKDFVIRITRFAFINDGNPMTAFFTHDGKPECVWIVGSREQYKQFPLSTKGYIFDAYVYIPMPFKKGDILTRKKGWDKEDDGNIFVLDLFDRDDPEWRERFSNKNLRSTDESVRGYNIDERGYLWDSGSAYDLEQLVYYKEKLIGPQRLLHFVSLYLKNKIRLPELLTMQNRIILEHQIDNDLDYYKIDYK